MEAEGRRTEGNVTSQSRTAEEESRLAQRDVSDLQLAHRCPIPTSHRPCHAIHTLVMGPAHLTDDTEKPYRFFSFFFQTPKREMKPCGGLDEQLNPSKMNKNALPAAAGCLNNST